MKMVHRLPASTSKGLRSTFRTGFHVTAGDVQFASHRTAIATWVGRPRIGLPPIGDALIAYSIDLVGGECLSLFDFLRLTLDHLPTAETDKLL